MLLTKHQETAPTPPELPGTTSLWKQAAREGLISLPFCPSVTSPPGTARPDLHPWAGAGAELGQGSRVSMGLDLEQSMSFWFDPGLLQSYRKLPGNHCSPSFPEMVVQVKPEQQGVKDLRISTKSL